MAKMKNEVPDKVIVWALNSLIGEVTQNMRMVSFSYGRNRARFLFYLMNDVSEDDREAGEIVALNFDAGLERNLDNLEVDFITTKEPLGRLDHLDQCLFRRKEE